MIYTITIDDGITALVEKNLGKSVAEAIKEFLVSVAKFQEGKDIIAAAPASKVTNEKIIISSK